MAKRTATSELTDRNWDHEDEHEEAGEFSKATDEALKLRQIIKAKRKVPQSSEGPSAFAGFGGFSFKPTQTSTPMLGSGLKTESKTEQMRQLAGKTGYSSPVKQKETPTNGQPQNGSSASPSASPARTSYLTNLKCLNESVLKWISQHVEKNPYCILTPIFKDYEKHVAELEDSQAEGDTKGLQSKPDVPMPDEPAEGAPPSLPKTGLTFGLAQLKANKSTSATPFSGFGFNRSASSTSTAPATSGFSFSVGNSDNKPSTMSTISEATGEEDEYVPPKPEVKEIQEEGALYTKKCKIFYQKDGQWTDRGVGYLHLKESNDKTQLLIRADTNLGTILLNIMLSSSIPLARQGKNNVSMVCVPNPPIDPKADAQKPVPMLIRVKTGDDADELLSKLKEMQK